VKISIVNREIVTQIVDFIFYTNIISPNTHP